MNIGLTSMEFIFAIPIIILLYYLVPKRFRQYFVLLVNVLFYSCFGLVYLSFILGTSLAIWLFSLYSKDRSVDDKKRATIGSICVTVISALLLFYKFSPHLISSIVAPLGISFYTLQAISYVLDVKKGIIEPETNLIKLFIYLSFFPTITSGPIYRYKDFIVEHNRNITELKADYYEITGGIIYMLYGYFLKLVIAERAAKIVNAVYDGTDEKEYLGVVLFIVAILYSIQIFADFAGYSAIVIGLAQLMGYHIPENFAAPYLSRSIKGFWRRWHISLSNWLKDYIYIPLGGNRKGKIRKYFNILITFFVSGLWHGTVGHFVIWGMLHGIYQIAGEVTKDFRRRVLALFGVREESAFHILMQRIITFLMVTFAWLFFRMGISQVLDYLRKMISTFNSGIGEVIRGGLWNLASPFEWMVIIFSVMAVCFVDSIYYKKKLRIDDVLNQQEPIAKGIVVIILSLTILILGVYGDQHDASYFVYRNF